MDGLFAWQQLPRLLRAVLVVVFSATAWGQSYYVSPSGDDANSGTSASAPWQTIAQVNRASLSAGSTVYFQGGASFPGTLYFQQGHAGTAANPITITSYGTGRAVINGGTARAFYAYNVAGVAISNINFAGAGAASNSDGIYFYADLPGNIKLSYINIDQVDIQGFGGTGIVMGGYNGTTGFSDVSITNATIHDNTWGGILTYGYGTNHFAHRNVYVAHCSIYNHLGDPSATSSTGSGIILGSVDGGTVERCEAYNNGVNNTSTSGPVGIWAYESNNVTFQYNESHHNRSRGGDGGGFDFDGGMSNSVMQYNYSHDNDGAGYLLAEYSGGSPNNGNVIRYNVSENDSRSSDYGAIYLFSTVNDAEIYNNTVYISPAPISAPSGISTVPWSGSNVHFRNNIVQSTAGVPMVAVNSGSALAFQGNDYWPTGGAFVIRDHGTTYGSLASWRSAWGQETLAGAATGQSVDPGLQGAGAGGTIGNPDSLDSLTAYRLSPNSPLIDKGLDLVSVFGISAGAHDFFGESIPAGAGYDVGTNEATNSTAALSPQYVGCYTDTSTRALPAALAWSGSTVESCVSLAKAQSLAYAGVQYGGQCFGGNSLGYSETSNSDCNMPCAANPAEICGGFWRNSIYAATTAPAPAPAPAPPPQPAPTPPPAPACAGNLIVNGDFENGLAPTENWGGVSIVSSPVHGGNFAAQIASSGGGAGQFLNANAFQVGATYEMTAYSGTADPNGYAWMGVKGNDAAGNVLFNSYATITAPAWTRYTMDFVVPAGTSQILFWFWKNSDALFPSAPLAVDDFCLLKK